MPKSEDCKSLEREALTEMFQDICRGNVSAGEAVRIFATGATRSPLGDKLQYEGYLSPIVLQRFAQYMKLHQTQADGRVRPADNWQRGIPPESLMDSLSRHYMDVWLHHRGYGDRAAEDIEEALCAMMFNTMAYLKTVLEEEDDNAYRRR